jgi:hypothetical protein
MQRKTTHFDIDGHIVVHSHHILLAAASLDGLDMLATRKRRKAGVTARRI